LDGVWIPSTCKEQIPGNGYTPFDHYDLGDKYQKGYLRTAMGTKDELLRMVAVMHANGLQVIQDVVLNHMDGAGSQYGHGAIDPEALDVQQKNFRYACWATPANNEDANHAAMKTRMYNLGRDIEYNF
jgi:alpha-amylase